MGTNPNMLDTDTDGMNDKIDVQPLCPNRACDERYGENEENCQQDCGSSNKGIVFGAVIIILAVIGFYLFSVFKKGAHKTTSEKKRELINQPLFDVEKFKEFEERKRRSKKQDTNVEKQIEQSFEKMDRFLRK